MNKLVLAMACVVTGLGGVAVAQPEPGPGTSPPQPSRPPTDYPQSSAPATPDTGNAAHTGGTDQHALMKQCMSQQEQQQSTTGRSKEDIKKYCKDQVKTQNPPRPQ